MNRVPGHPATAIRLEAIVQATIFLPDVDWETPMTAKRLLLLICVILWGWSFVATKLCLSYLTPVELIGLRFLVGIPVLAAIIWVKRLRFEFDRRERRSIAFGSVVLALHFLIQVTGIKYTSATNTGWIIAVTPLVMAVLAFFVLNERLGLRTITGIIVATCGILVLVSRGDFGGLHWLSNYGDWLVLASAHTWALYTVATRDVTRSRNPLTVTLAVLLPTAIIVWSYMAFTSDWVAFLHLPLDCVLSILYLGILALALAHWFWQEGIAAIGAARAGIYLYLEPIATTALAIPLLHERFGVFTALGGFLVLGGVYWAERRGKNNTN
jgi:drug/metabolite transporter (DMT)-like permease